MAMTTGKTPTADAAAHAERERARAQADAARGAPGAELERAAREVAPGTSAASALRKAPAFGVEGVADYYDAVVQNGHGANISLMTHDPSKLDDFFRRLPRNLDVADVGSGLGDLAQHAQAAYGHRVFGVDASPRMVEQLRARNIPGAQAEVGDARNLPVPSHSKDAALSSHVLIHLDREGGAQALRELHRVLKPGGTAFIGTNVVEDPGGRELRESHGEEMKGIDDAWFYFWNRGELLQAIRDAGFKLEERDIALEQKWAPWFRQMYVRATAL